MALSDNLRKSVAKIFAKLGPSLPKISHEPWTGDDADGNRTYGPAVQVSAIIVNTHSWVRSMQNGISVAASAQIDGMGNVLSKTQVIVPATVGLMDRVKINGVSNQILSVDSILDEAGNPYFSTVYF